MTTLNFEFKNDKAKWKSGKFEIDNLQITGDDEKVNFEYDDIKLYLDDELYTGGISTWSCDNVSADFLFESVLNSYLRNNIAEFKNFDDEWSIFNKIKNLAVEQDGLITKLPVYDNKIIVYDLDLATSGYRFYCYMDNFMLCDEEGCVITDMENFYSEAMYQTICKIIKGKTKCLYKSENYDTLIKEYGGEEGFLKEFDTEE